MVNEDLLLGQVKEKSLWWAIKRRLFLGCQARNYFIPFSGPTRGADKTRSHNKQSYLHLIIKYDCLWYLLVVPLVGPEEAINQFWKLRNQQKYTFYCPPQWFPLTIPNNVTNAVDTNLLERLFNQHICVFFLQQSTSRNVTIYVTKRPHVFLKIVSTTSLH